MSKLLTLVLAIGMLALSGCVSMKAAVEHSESNYVDSEKYCIHSLPFPGEGCDCGNSAANFSRMCGGFGRR